MEDGLRPYIFIYENNAVLLFLKILVSLCETDIFESNSRLLLPRNDSFFYDFYLDIIYLGSILCVSGNYY